MLGLAGVLAAAQLPVMSSLLASVYHAPSTRRHYAFTFFLAGGNFIAVIFGGLGFGLSATLTRDWRTSFVYLAVMFFVVLLVAVFTVPNLRKAVPYPEIMVQDSEEHIALLTSEPGKPGKRHDMRTD